MQFTKLRLPSGETLPVLSREDGSLYQLALLFTLHDRTRRGASTTEIRTRRLGDLYGALEDLVDEDPDAVFLNGRLTADLVRQSFSWTDENIAQGDVCSASVRNGQVAVWRDFYLRVLTFLLDATEEPDTSSERVRDTQVELLSAAVKIRALLDDYTANPRMPREVHPFSVREIQVLEDVLGPGDSGKFPHAPFDRLETSRRNWGLFILMYFGGVRRSEALSLYRDDLGPEESAAERMVRQVNKEALSFQVVRRPDDPDDPRSDPARVKRTGRRVLIGEESMAFLWDLRDEVNRGDPDHPFLIQTVVGHRPLSKSTLDSLAQKLRPALEERWAELHPDEPHSFDEFHWHRLRHTRAWIRLLTMLGDQDPQNGLTASQAQAFRESMGWKSDQSAAPYIRRLQREIADHGWHDILTREGQ